jgi:hypothetical protein
MGVWGRAVERGADVCRGASFVEPKIVASAPRMQMPAGADKRESIG